VRPTSFGRDAAAAARDIVARLDALRMRPTLSVSGRVRLGAIATMQSDVMPEALKRLRFGIPRSTSSIGALCGATLAAARLLANGPDRAAR